MHRDLPVRSRNDPNQPTPPAGMVLVPAPACPFQMGDSFYPNERPVHTVYVSAFYMDVNDVTVGLWNQVVNWAASHGYDLRTRSGSYNPGGNYPVTDVSWYDAVKWANARSEMEGLTPAYYTDSSHLTVYRAGNIDLTNDAVDWRADGYRLPTEAEWEKAARGGLSSQRYPWGNGIDSTKTNYWPDEPSPARDPTPTGTSTKTNYLSDEEVQEALADDLAKLGQLHASGSLTDVEFRQRTERITKETQGYLVGWYTADELEQSREQIWYGTERDPRIHVAHPIPVRSYPPNGYGLYDMASNVKQWVWDWSDEHDGHYATNSDYYADSPGKDPCGPASGSHRRLRCI